MVRAVQATLQSDALDAAFKAEAISIPGESLIADRLTPVDPDAIHTSRETLRAAIGSQLRSELLNVYGAGGAAGGDLSPEAKGIRRLRSVALGLLASADPSHGAALAKAQFDGADNMTDRQGALAVLVSLDAPERQAALDAFYGRFHDNALVIDKWFALQAVAQRPDTLEQVKTLAGHPDFTIGNPNRLRALVGTFAHNHWAFNRADGTGYAFVADMIIDADKLNPQTAARMVAPFGRWKQLEPNRSRMMKAALERIAGAPGLSKDVFEQASKSLA